MKIFVGRHLKDNFKYTCGTFWTWSLSADLQENLQEAIEIFTKIEVIFSEVIGLWSFNAGTAFCTESKSTSKSSRTTLMPLPLLKTFLK